MLELVQGDLEPDMPLTVTLDGVAQDLTGATSIVLRWVKPGAAVSTDVTLTPVDLLTGKVKRVWVAGDTSITGFHRGRIVITWTTGETQTFPNDGLWFYWVVYSNAP